MSDTQLLSAGSSGYVMAATCPCDGPAQRPGLVLASNVSRGGVEIVAQRKRSDLKAILFADDGSAPPTASIAQYASPGTARERVSCSEDSKQRGFLPPARRNRCVPLRRPHSARRSTCQSVLRSPGLRLMAEFNVALKTAARKAGQPIVVPPSRGSAGLRFATRRRCSVVRVGA